MSLLHPNDKKILNSLSSVMERASAAYGMTYQEADEIGVAVITAYENKAREIRERHDELLNLDD